LGESNQKTELGINAAIPALLGRFTNLASTSDGATRLGFAVDNADEGILSNISSMFGKNTYSASSSLRSVLGDGGISDLSSNIGRTAGLSSSTVTTLLGLVAPVVLGVLRRLKRTQGLDTSGLANLLFSQRDNIEDAMPESMRAVETDTGIREPIRDFRQANAPREHRASSFGWVIPLALLALLAGLFWHWASRRSVRAGNESAQITEQRSFASLDALMNKYRSAIQIARQQGVQISAMTVQGGKLMIQGSAPSVDAANRFNQEIVRINPNMDDIAVNLKVNEAQAQSPTTKSTDEAVSREKPAATNIAPISGSQTYIVKRGDTLAKISKQFYGNTNGVTRIFTLNKTQLKNPNALVVGQHLEIPGK